MGTKTNEDDGLPHCLEHLIYNGSTEHRYKGFLDTCATQCLSHSLNAVTHQAFTVYELKSASKDGFLKLLPLYMDNLFSPALKASEFVTEVHHINDKGTNNGVVYAEMLANCQVWNQ
uniref:Peptidase M16 N-terminal domain-containing protein n=1 Tax=Meloidogyne floridensis TaxID=298350 RepID=A0A915P9N8_9BILA